MADPPPPDAQPEQPPAAEKAPAAPLTPEAEDAPEVQEAESEVDEEYVSDPDDALPEMRRREASDDEGSEDGRRPPRARIDPDHDHDGQGAPEDYEGEVEDEEEEEEYYDDLLEEEAAEGLEEEEYDARAVPPKEVAAGQGEEGDKAVVEGEEADGEEKKEQEPFAVPTSGAFYMHDDRFAENGRGGGGRRCTFLETRTLVSVQLAIVVAHRYSICRLAIILVSSSMTITGFLTPRQSKT
jgi:hypothetical protein